MARCDGAFPTKRPGAGGHDRQQVGDVGGYAPLMADMNGGFRSHTGYYQKGAEVFRLSSLRTRKPDGALGPGGRSHSGDTSVERPPTAELRENRTIRIRCRDTK